MKNTNPHTLLNIQKQLKLSDFGALFPYSDADLRGAGYFAEVTKNLILINIGDGFKNKFNEVLFVLPELNLN